MGSENRFASPFGSGEHEGGVSLNPGSTDTVPSPPPPSVSNGLNTPSSNTLSTVTKANPQSHGEEVKMTFFNDQSESSKDVSVSVTPPPKSKEEVKDMEVEEKIAVRHEGDGEKEVFYEEKKGNEKDEDDKDEVGYSMSSTVYPGLWEPEYFTG
jgi:hypothetical protein